VDEDKREFLNFTAASMGAVAVGASAWTVVNSMNPAADTLALATTEVDLGALKEGESMTVVWRGKPVFIHYRTPEQIAAAKAVPMSDLKDPQADEDRVKKEQYLVLVGICTHLGCVPLGQKPADPKGEFGGWFCPCHGSQYDTSGRIRKGPAPQNLLVPPYAFLSDTVIKIG
jgi:ubiquinol-cytochrome c reductase iron-sulfur subunit